MTMEPTATRARTQGDKGQPFRPQRNARFERAARMQTPAARAAARAHAWPDSAALSRAAPRTSEGSPPVVRDTVVATIAPQDREARRCTDFRSTDAAAAMCVGCGGAAAR